MAATGGLWDNLWLVCERFPCIPRWMDAGARWNTPLQTSFRLEHWLPCAQYSVLIKFSSSFRIERCFVQNTELFNAHQIFVRKIFVELIYLQKLWKFFATKIWNHTVLNLHKQHYSKVLYNKIINHKNKVICIQIVAHCSTIQVCGTNRVTMVSIIVSNFYTYIIMS